MGGGTVRQYSLRNCSTEAECWFARDVCDVGAVAPDERKRNTMSMVVVMVMMVTMMVVMVMVMMMLL